MTFFSNNIQLNQMSLACLAQYIANTQKAIQRWCGLFVPHILSYQHRESRKSLRFVNLQSLLQGTAFVSIYLKVHILA